MKHALLALVALALTATVAQADSLNVRLVGSCGTPGQAYGVAVSGNYAYVADWSAGLRVISVSDPAHPVQVGYHGTADLAYDVAVVGDYAYVAAGNVGLQICQFYGAGIEEGRQPRANGLRPTATVIRGVLMIGDRGPKTGDRAELLDASGRKVLDIRAGANDVSRLAPGVYFVSERGTKNEEPRTVKIVIQH